MFKSETIHAATRIRTPIYDLLACSQLSTRIHPFVPAAHDPFRPFRVPPPVTHAPEGHIS